MNTLSKLKERGIAILVAIVLAISGVGAAAFASMSAPDASAAAASDGRDYVLSKIYEKCPGAESVYLNGSTVGAGYSDGGAHNSCTLSVGDLVAPRFVGTGADYYTSIDVSSLPAGQHDVMIADGDDVHYRGTLTISAPATLTLSAAGAPVASPVDYSVYKLFEADVMDGMASNIAYHASFTPEILMGAMPTAPADPKAAIVARANAELGKPYALGACGPDSYDPSGLVSYAVAGAHTRLGTAASFMAWDETTDPAPGDICVAPGHCGIYIGEGKMIHAANPAGVSITGVQEGMVYRVAPVAAAASARAVASDDYTNAQIAAQYIADNIQNGPIVGTSFGMDLARAVADASEPVASITSNETPVEVDGPGYYLVVRKDALSGDNSAASSPIFVLAGEGNTTITEKSAVPAAYKQVKENSTGEWGTEADYTMSDSVDFRLVGTLPANLTSYERYSYTFHDEGASFTDVKNIHVYIDDVEVSAAAYSFSGTTNRWAISFDDILSCGVDVNPSSRVVVEYSARMDAYAPEGVINSVYVEYANNPANLDSKGTTAKAEVKVYNYELRIDKVDNATLSPLSGVGFTVQNAEGKYIASRVEPYPGTEIDRTVIYTQDAPYTWLTDDEGRINIEGLDCGSYTIKETAPAVDYEPLKGDIVAAVSVSADRSEMTTDLTSAPDLVSFGKGEILVKNIKKLGLPLTGESGIFALVGLGLLITGAALLIRRRRDAEEE